MIQLPEGFDSIFRYIVVVSQRAEQLVNGAKPRSESRHDKATLVALDDVNEGRVEWRILTQEELDAQRQAIIDQLRAEVGVSEGETAEGTEIPDVLPTGDTAVGEGPLAAADDDGERDDELLRLQKLLGMAAGGPDGEEESEESEEAAEEPVTIDLDEAAKELEGSADDDDEEEES
jgi:DNA-directed RNA polymerase subunit K/omega